MDLSIVVPFYNEQENVSILFKELNQTLKNLKIKSEIIFVDDGSTDNTFNELLKLKKQNSIVKIIKFRKNFGQTAAMKAGFDNSKGKTIITMDGDLQNDPKDIPKLLSKMSKGFDVVSGWRADRKDPTTKKLPSLLSNWLHKRLTGLQIHDSGCSLKAYRRETLEDAELFGEIHRFIPALVAWKGFKVGETKVNHRPRKFGKTKYGLLRLYKGFLDLLNIKFWSQYATRPLHLFGGIGLPVLILGTLLGLYLSYQRIFLGIGLANRPILFLAILMVIIGIQFIIFGFLADIIIKNYFQTKKQKPYSIEKIL